MKPQNEFVDSAAGRLKLGCKVIVPELLFSADELSFRVVAPQSQRYCILETAS
jgi:hypothetical protein